MKSEQAPTIRQPSLLDALIPLVFMIVMLTWSVILFGIDAAAGPLQVALLMSAVVAGVVAHKNGHPWEVLGEEIVDPDNVQRLAPNGHPWEVLGEEIVDPDNVQRLAPEDQPAMADLPQAPLINQMK